MREILAYMIAVPMALLPRRRWHEWDLPIEHVNFASAVIACLCGAALGITGYFTYMDYVLAQREWTAPSRARRHHNVSVRRVRHARSSRAWMSRIAVTTVSGRVWTR